MKYQIQHPSLPARLRHAGVQVWVGDHASDAADWAGRGLLVVSLMMVRDVFREVVVIFAVPRRRRVTPGLLQECRRCALSWALEWNAGSGGREK